MLNFENIFKNHFDTKEISDDNIKKFTEENIQRLIANNGGGEFTTAIADTTNAYTAYFGKMSSEDILFAAQQSLTKTNDKVLADFKKMVSQKEGTVKGQYGVNSPVYQEFFPNGLTEYSNSNKSNVLTLITRMEAASTAHVADLGAPFVAIWTGFKSDWNTTRNAQLLKIGQVDSTKTGTATTRDALEIQLQKNLFFVGFNFPGDVARCMDFFKQDIIRYDVNSATDGKGRLIGLIRDFANGNPLIDATVEILNTNIPIAKNKSDGYKTQRMDIGNKQVRVAYPGKPERIVNVNVIDDGDTTLNVDL
ncbi:MAG: carboxypeptidase-like regulatory domain-containing protein [Bacteroidota bacterium]